MIQGYRMAGPPPHGEPPPAGPTSREWPVWLGFAAFLVAFLIANLGYAVIVGISGAEIDDTPAWVDLSTALLLQTALIACALAGAALFKPLHAWQFGLRRTRFWPAVGWSVLAMAAFYAFAAAWTALAGEPEQTTAQDIGADESRLALVAAGVLFVVVAPIAEEFFFRGFFYGTLRTRLAPGWAALVCGAVFGVIHAATGIEAVPALMVLGIVLCLVREKTGSLYPCIGIHAFNNAIAYATLTDVDPGVALGLGAAMLVACGVIPRFVWNRAPAAA
jgi:membrane protease YdiL (CAAX protease family)